MLDSQELRHSLKQRLAEYISDPESVLQDIWPLIVLALNDASQGAVLEDPLALLDDEKREMVLQASLSTMNPETRQLFERTIGLWA